MASEQTAVRALLESQCSAWGIEFTEDLSDLALSARLALWHMENENKLASLQTALAAANAEIEAARKERSPGADYPYWFDEAKKLAAQLAAANARADANYERWKSTESAMLTETAKSGKMALEQSQRAEAAEADRDKWRSELDSTWAMYVEVDKDRDEAVRLLRRLSDNEARLEAQVTINATLRAQKQAWIDARAFLARLPSATEKRKVL